MKQGRSFGHISNWRGMEVSVKNVVSFVMSLVQLKTLDFKFYGGWLICKIARLVWIAITYYLF